MRTTSHDPVAARHEGEYMAMRLTGKRALVAVAAGLALAGAPAFALTAAPAPAVAAEQAEGVTVQVEGGQSTFTDAINKDHASTIELKGNGDDGKGMFNFWSYTTLFGKTWSSTLGTDAETVNVNSDLTIVNRTGNANAYLYGVHFEVKPGAKLTLVDVNIDDARNEGATGPAVPAITVQPGGSLETKGTGDIATDNGQGEAWAVKLEGSDDANTKATAVLGAAPSGFMANIGEDGWTADNAGNYGGTYCVTAGLNSDLTITDGRFTTENAQHQAIQSYGSVKIEPASDSVVFSTNNEVGDYLGTVEIDGTLNGQPTGAKLVANHSIFGYIAPGGWASVGDVTMKSALQLNGSAKAYLTDSVVNTINDSKVGTLPAVWLDSDATLYEQEKESNPAQTPSTFSTNFDTPAFQNDFKSVYEGDHLTKNQYKAQVTLPSQNNGVKEDVTNANLARGLWKLTENVKPSDLESLVNAKREKLTDGAQEVENQDPEQPGTTVLSANLDLGKSQVYGEYELAKNDNTSIEGDGHAYAFSQVYDLQAGWDVSSYRGNGTYTAPTAGTENSDVAGEVAPEGTVFAGWFTQGGDLRTGTADNGYTSDVLPGALQVKDGAADKAALSDKATSGYAYAKFVPAALLDLKSEGPAKKPAAGSTYIARFMIAKDSYNYNGAAFKIEELDKDGKATGRHTTINTLNNWDYVTAEGKKVYAKDVFKQDLPLLWCRVYLKGIAADFDGSFRVTPSWTTMDGTVVSGRTEVISADALLKGAE